METWVGVSCGSCVSLPVRRQVCRKRAVHVQAGRGADGLRQGPTARLHESVIHDGWTVEGRDRGKMIGDQNPSGVRPRIRPRPSHRLSPPARGPPPDCGHGAALLPWGLGQHNAHETTGWTPEGPSPLTCSNGRWFSPQQPQIPFSLDQYGAERNPRIPVGLQSCFSRACQVEKGKNRKTRLSPFYG